MGVVEHLQEPMHHAYLSFGTFPEDISSRPAEGLYVVRCEEGIGIQEVRLLQSYAEQSVTGTTTRRVVCCAPLLTVQAQNALLKMIEELQAGVYFFLCVPVGTFITTTLRSRCVVLEEAVRDTYSSTFASFITKTAAQRLAEIDTVWELGEGVRHSEILRLIEDTELYLRECIVTHPQRAFRVAEIVSSLRAGVQQGAFHKGTLHLLAFI